MNARTLTTREKRMLAGCIAAILIAGTSLMLNEFLSRRAALDAKIASLQSEKKVSELWLKDRVFQQKRATWLEANLPATESLGRAQGQMLEEVQNVALDRELKVVKTTPNDPTKTANYQEVSVTMNLTGDMAAMLDGLATLQSPEKFQVVKMLEIEPDSKSKLKTPQCICNITLARWFKPEDS